VTCFNIAGDVQLNDDETDILTVSGVRLIRERLRVAIGTALGTWRYDATKGFPYQEILAARPDSRRIQLIFSVWLAEQAGIVSVDSVTVSFVERLCRIDFSATTDAGSLSDSIGLL
jgi:hypothetical protein